MYRRAVSLAVIIAALIGASQLPAHAEILQNTEQYALGAANTVAVQTPQTILQLEKGRVLDAVKSDEFDERAHTDDDAKPLQPQTGISPTDGGSIPSGQHDTLIEKDGICRWVDNDSGIQYFIPKRTPEEVAAFVANLPSGTGDSNCCPAKVVTFEASDGQQRRFKLDIGREGAPGPRGAVSLLHVFNLTRAEDGATWQERVSETYTCENGAWTGNGPVRTGAAPELILPKFCGTHLDGERWFEVTGNATRAANAYECADGAGTRNLAWNIENEFRCAGGVPTLTGTTRTSGEAWSGSCAVNQCAPKFTHVVATWSGQLRRTSSSNYTGSISGFSSAGNVCIYTTATGAVGMGCNNSNNSAAAFKLIHPAKDTHIKITANYGRGPIVAEMDIAAGQVILGGAGNVFGSGNKGHPFFMTNDAIYLPAYNNSPNLYSLRAEYDAYIIPQICKAECGSAAGTCASGAAGNITTCSYPSCFVRVPVTTWTCTAAVGRATTDCRQ